MSRLTGPGNPAQRNSHRGRQELNRRSSGATAYRASAHTKSGDEQAAYAVVAWLQRADRGGSLSGFLSPSLSSEEREITKIEGWILELA